MENTRENVLYVRLDFGSGDFFVPQVLWRFCL